MFLFALNCWRFFVFDLCGCLLWLGNSVGCSFILWLVLFDFWFDVWLVLWLFCCLFWMFLCWLRLVLTLCYLGVYCVFWGGFDFGVCVVCWLVSWGCCALVCLLAGLFLLFWWCFILFGYLFDCWFVLAGRFLIVLVVPECGCYNLFDITVVVLWWLLRCYFKAFVVDMPIAGLFVLLLF